MAADSQPHPAVARIIAPEEKAQSLGSGTLVHVTDQYGLVITNWHVVRHAQGPVEVSFADGFRSQGTVIKIDDAWDLAAVGIWRPAIQPVAIASQPPRQGDPLTIAGYGSGQYRAVSGRCMQYVAPSGNHPFEMIELAAEARQGDSGGPIFNAEGQLAGVLLGARDGRTVGSYCGRVNYFLVDVKHLLDRQQPPAQPAAEAIARQASPAREQLVKLPWRAADSPAAVTAAPALDPPLPVERGPSDRVYIPAEEQSAATVAVLPVEPMPRAQDEFYRPATIPEPSFQSQPPTTAAFHGSPGNEVMRLTDVIGTTRGEQVKSVLAGIGGLALAMLFLRVLRTAS